MKTIKQSYLIKSPINKVWETLVNPDLIESWGAGPATMDDKVGTEFKLWGGDIHGKNLDVIQEEKLVQEWFGGDWPQPSKVTFTLSEEDAHTRVDLLHEDIPDAEVEEINQGWKDYYLGPLKDYLEGR